MQSLTEEAFLHIPSSGYKDVARAGETGKVNDFN